jgi:hypothetical protein
MMRFSFAVDRLSSSVIEFKTTPDYLSSLA